MKASITSTGKKNRTVINKLTSVASGLDDIIDKAEKVEYNLYKTFYSSQKGDQLDSIEGRTQWAEDLKKAIESGSSHTSTRLKTPYSSVMTSEEVQEECVKYLRKKLKEEGIDGTAMVGRITSNLETALKGNKNVTYIADKKFSNSKGTFSQEQFDGLGLEMETYINRFIWSRSAINGKDKENRRVPDVVVSTSSAGNRNSFNYDIEMTFEKKEEGKPKLVVGTEVKSNLNKFSITEMNPGNSFLQTMAKGMYSQQREGKIYVYVSEQSLINAIKEIMDRKYGKGNVIFESKGEVMLLSEMLLSLKPGAGAKLQLTVENDIFSGTYYKRDSNAFDQQTANQFVRNSKAKLLYAKTGKQTTTK